MTVSSPISSDTVELFADWMELISLFRRGEPAKIDEIINALDLGQDTEHINTGEHDAIIEQIYLDVSDQIKLRIDALGDDAYPFRMSRNGESVLMTEPLTYGQTAYLSSLAIHHSWTGGKLKDHSKLTDGEIRRGRDLFEVFSAIAAIGLTGGPSFHIGSNRADGLALLDRIRHICETVNEGTARNQLHPDAPARANDDGIDIIAVQRENDGPPHRTWNFGQSAAGADFRGKSAHTEIDNFLEVWFDHNPFNVQPVMFIPALLDESDLRREGRRLGHIIHRLRMPRYAQIGFNLAENDNNLIHFVDDYNQPIAWFHNYLVRVREIWAA